MRFLEDRMIDVFGGNMEAHGSDHGSAVREPVTPRLMKAHLEGITGIGIYPMWYQDDEWWVKWGCCDIDTGIWMEAYALAKTLQAMGFTPFIERSRSKGWHVWVFCKKPTLARHMRRALKVAYAACNLQAREANPKAETLHDGQLGNYVRLPFKGGMVTDLDRQVMMHAWSGLGDGYPVTATEWLTTFDDTCRTDPSQVEHWGSQWVEPVKKTFVKSDLSDDALREMFVGMSPELFRFVADGPGGAGDRSEALVALAHKAKRAGYDPAEIYGIVCAADQRWGKYHQRPDGDIYLTEIVERVI